MRTEPNEDVLLRYLGGEPTPADLAAVSAWMAADPHAREVVGRLTVAWNPAPTDAFDPDDALRQRLRAVIKAARPEAARQAVLSELIPAPRSKRWMVWGVGVAAAAALVLLLRPSAPPAANDGSRPARDLHTTRAERSTVAMGDGISVTLDAASRLTVIDSAVAPTGEWAPVEVELVGRARFDVTHRDGRRFRVRTATGVVDDEGTEFVIKAFEGDRAAEVVVLSGAVLVKSLSGNAPLSVKAGQGARIDREQVARFTTRSDMASYLAWVEGGHVFDGTLLSEVAAELERSYDVEVSIPDSAVAARRITNEFGREGVDAVLDFIRVALNVDVSRSGRTVVIRAKARPGSR